jgi:hypothetical protein
MIPPKWKPCNRPVAVWTVMEEDNEFFRSVARRNRRRMRQVKVENKVKTHQKVNETSISFNGLQINNWIPLYDACFDGNIEVVRSLLKEKENRLNINWQTKVTTTTRGSLDHPARLFSTSSSHPRKTI